MSCLRDFSYEYLYYGQRRRWLLSEGPALSWKGVLLWWVRQSLNFKFKALNFHGACHELGLWPSIGHLASLDIRVIHRAHLFASATQMWNDPGKSKGHVEVIRFSLFPGTKKWGGPAPWSLNWLKCIFILLYAQMTFYVKIFFFFFKCKIGNVAALLWV